MKQRLESLIAGAIGAAVMAVLLSPMIRSVEASYTPVPSGTIVHFNATSCPAGWTEFTSGRGAYIVGRVSGGTLNTIVGTALTNQENRDHTHQYSHQHTTPATDLVNATVSGATLIGEDSGVTTNFFFNNGGWSQIVRSGASGTPSNSIAIPLMFTVSQNTTTTTATSTATSAIAPYIQLLLCSKS